MVTVLILVTDECTVLGIEYENILWISFLIFWYIGPTWFYFRYMSICTCFRIDLSFESFKFCFDQMNGFHLFRSFWPGITPFIFILTRIRWPLTEILAGPLYALARIHAGPLAGICLPLARIHWPLGGIRWPLTGIRWPLARIRLPLVGICWPPSWDSLAP